jgi:hypothetical protein
VSSTAVTRKHGAISGQYSSTIQGCPYSWTDTMSRRLQHWPLRDEDLLSPRRGQQSEHHERVGDGLQAEPRDGVRAALPNAGQRSRYARR